MCRILPSMTSGFLGFYVLGMGMGSGLGFWWWWWLLFTMGT